LKNGDQHEIVEETIKDFLKKKKTPALCTRPSELDIQQIYVIKETSMKVLSSFELSLS
jgi:hypothetical protein